MPEFYEMSNRMQVCVLVMRVICVAPVPHRCKHATLATCQRRTVVFLKRL